MNRRTPPLVRALLALIALSTALTAYGQQYRWVDENGRVQYTDRPPPPSAKEVQKKNLNAGPPPAAAEPYALTVAMKNAPVKLYSSPDCGGYCSEARTLLNERGIPFSEVSVATAEQVQELKALAGRTSVPVMLVGGSVQLGFEPGAYHRALDAAGYPRSGLLRPRNQKAPPPPKPAAEAPATGAPAVPPADSARQ